MTPLKVPLSFFLRLTLLPLLVQEVISSSDPKLEQLKKQWDSMDPQCAEYCQHTWKHMSWQVYGYPNHAYGAHVKCYSSWSRPDPFDHDAFEKALSKCLKICKEHCNLACEELEPNFGFHIACPYEGYLHKFSPTTAASTTEIFKLEDPFKEDDHMSLSSYLGEPGSLQFGLTIAGIVVAVLVIIFLIVACCLSATGRGGPREEQSESVPGSTYTFQYPKPMYQPSPKAPPAPRPPQPQPQKSSEDESEASQHVTIAPRAKTGPGPLQMPSGQQPQQQFAYQLVPIQLGGGGGQTQQQFMPMGHGQQPLVIYLPHNFDPSEGTPVLIPLPAGSTDGGGKKGAAAADGSGSEARSTTTEADNDN